MAPDAGSLQYREESVQALVRDIKEEPWYAKNKKGKSKYSFYIELMEDPSNPGNYIWAPDLTSECLVDPENTFSTINAISYAESKWIDMGRLVDRPSIGGIKTPVFSPFVAPVQEVDDWAVIDAPNGYIPNGGETDFNDIEVFAPDVGLPHYIPDTNEVAIQFQGTDAKVPGSKVPDTSLATEWTPDPTELHGKQFIRYRIRMNVAKGVEVDPSNYKPQVNFVRLRFKY
jgi:hypothetical protein